MMALLFVLILFNLILIWCKLRKSALTLFFVMLAIDLYWFIHHASEKLNLNF